MVVAAMRDDLPLRTIPLLVLLIASLYLVLHPYQGLVDDARLYTLQALNHLHPELYGNDVFLKYGSQDSYTLFTPLYSALISLFGVEPAASLITFVSTVAFLVAAWLFARVAMPALFAWLGLGMLVLIPGFYGSEVAFSVIESFVTPRSLVQALVLFSLTAWLHERRLLSATVLFAAALLHPIMTFPAIVLLILVNCDFAHWKKVWPLAPAVVLVVAAALSGWLPIARWQFDNTWWQPMADRVPHLVISHWSRHDWARIATVLASLAIAAIRLTRAGQRLAVGMLITCIVLLLLSWVGGDLLKIVLVVQGQPWRCLWLATTIAALLLPWLTACCWGGPLLSRCGILLLITAWLIGHASLAFWFSIPAVIAVACSDIRVPDRYARLAVLTAGVLMTVVALCVFSLTWNEFGGANVASNSPAWLQNLRAICTDPLLPGATLLGAWHVVTSIRSRTVLASLTLTLMVGAALVAGAAARPWFIQSYSVKAQEAFAKWRAVIPPGSDVLWASKFVPSGDPMGAWLLLWRPSYYSAVQTNSELFSRPAAMELRNRARSIPLSLPTEMPIPISFNAHQPPSCRDIPTRYIVTLVAIRDAQLIPAPASLGPPFDQLELRICP
jgi:hypothetical protein